jgi:hypothetical protein
MNFSNGFQNWEKSYAPSLMKLCGSFINGLTVQFIKGLAFPLDVPVPGPALPFPSLLFAD